MDIYRFQSLKRRYKEKRLSFTADLRIRRSY
jgi:hypothetical protein